MNLVQCQNNVMNCFKCANISPAIGPVGRDIGLNYVVPTVPVEVLFIAESPPANNLNFFYNQIAANTRFRNRLFTLINLAGLKPVQNINQFNTRGYYLADAINCGWNKAIRPQPTQRQKTLILGNCLAYLEAQLRCLQPKAVVMMGNVAKMAGNKPQISKALAELNIPSERVIKIPFITTAPVTTKFLVDELSKLKGMGR